MTGICEICAEYAELGNTPTCARRGTSAFGPLIKELEGIFKGDIDKQDRHSVAKAIVTVDKEKLDLLRGLANITVNGLKGRVVCQNEVEVADRSLPACEDATVKLVAELVLERLGDKS